MKNTVLSIIRVLAFVFVSALPSLPALAQSPISYQGQLHQLNEPANGNFVFRFSLYDAEAAGQMLHREELPSLVVTNGSFRAHITPAETLIGSAPVWLEIAVRPTDLPEVPFITMQPRQRLTWAPQAIHARKAETVADDSISNQSLADGAVSAEKFVSGLFGPGLALQNNSVELSFAEGGTATTVARGDHRHFGQRWEGSVVTGEAGLEVVNTNPAGGSGLLGESRAAGGAGVRGIGFSRGVDGFSVGGFAVSGETEGGTAIYGSNGNSDTAGHAGYFNGRVSVTKNLHVSGGLHSELSEGWAVAGVTTGTGSGVYGSNGDSNTRGYAGYFNGRTHVSKDLSVNGVLHTAGRFAVGGEELFRILRTDWTTSGAPNIVLGCVSNSVSVSSIGNTISGGGATNALSIFGAYVDQPNYIVGNYGVIGGGLGNNIFGGLSNPDGSTIGGGQQNQIRSDAGWSTISGGIANLIFDDSWGSVISGGSDNLIGLDAAHGTIPGGSRNEVGSYAENAFAAGYRAKAMHPGSFVWADLTNLDFSSMADNQFAVRAEGGVHMWTRANHRALTLRTDSDVGAWLNLQNDSNGGITWSMISSGAGNGEGAGKLLFYDGGVARMQLDAGGLRVNGALVSSSDRHKKENFAGVNSREILEKVSALPISSWNYQDDKSTRHIGPMAQDFHAAFQAGFDDKHIATVDADGVALAAIQGLHQLVKEKDEKIESLENRLEALEALETLVKSLNSNK